MSVQYKLTRLVRKLMLSVFDCSVFLVCAEWVHCRHYEHPFPQHGSLWLRWRKTRIYWQRAFGWQVFIAADSPLLTRSTTENQILIKLYIAWRNVESMFVFSICIRLLAFLAVFSLAWQLKLLSLSCLLCALCWCVLLCWKGVHVGHSC